MYEEHLFFSNLLNINSIKKFYEITTLNFYLKDIVKDYKIKSNIDINQFYRQF